MVPSGSNHRSGEKLLLLFSINCPGFSSLSQISTGCIITYSSCLARRLPVPVSIRIGIINPAQRFACCTFWICDSQDFCATFGIGWCGWRRGNGSSSLTNCPSSLVRRNCYSASVTPLSSAGFQLQLFARPQPVSALDSSSRASRCCRTVTSSGVLGLS